MAPPNKATPKPGVAKRPTHDQLQDQAIANLTKDNMRLANLSGELLRLGQFQDEVLARAESWQIAARNVGSAYATAAKMHTDALAAQDKIEALKTQILFSVLTVATSGSLSWLSSGLAMAEKFPERLALIEAVEDAAQAGVGEVFSAVSPMIFTQQNKAVNIDPQVFQNERENAVSEAKIKVLERFGRIKSQWAAAPLETWDDYSEAKQLAEHNDWLKKADNLAGKDDLPSIAVMADELERGFWAAWMPGLKSRIRVGNRFGTQEEDAYASVGSAIEERLSKVDILKLANVEIHWYQSAGTEDTKLLAWAQGYKVKRFVSMS